MTENNGSRAKRLLRIPQGRMVAGVCTGLAAYFGVDVNLVRLAFGVLTVFYGVGILVYLIAWAIMPEEGEDSSILESFINKRRLYARTPPADTVGLAGHSPRVR